MADLRAALVGAVPRAYCILTAGQGKAAQYFVDTAESIPVIGGPITFGPRAFSNFRSLVCGEEPTPEVLDPGTTTPAGQCPVNYRWIWKYRYRDPNGFIRDTTGQNDVEVGPTNGPILGPITGPIQSAADPVQWTLIDGNGNEDGTKAFLPVGGEFLENDFQVLRADGLPDDCGEPVPPPPLAPGDRTINLPVNINDNDVNVDFTLNVPVLAPGGVLLIPVTIKGPNFNFDVNLNVGTGDIVFDFGGGSEGEGCCPELEGEPPETAIVRGVVIRNLEVQMNRYVQEIDLDAEPPIYGPYAGLIRFYRSYKGTRVYSEDIRVKCDNQDILCPFPGGAEGWVSERQTGASYQVEAYFAKVKAQPSEAT